MSGLKASVLANRGVISVSGEEARSFLQALITNNVEQVGDNKAIYAALLTPQGKYLFDFFVVAKGDALLLDCDGARAAELAKRLGFYKLRAKIVIKDVSDTFAIAALWGGPVPALDDVVIFPDPRLDELGHRAILLRPSMDEALVRSGAEIVDEGSYRRHRLRLGVGDAEDFESERSFPLELNFDELHGVDFKKGCFIGQEVTSRVKRRGSVRKRLIPAQIEGALPPPGTPIMANDRDVGMVFSGDAAAGVVLTMLRLDLIKGAKLTANGSTLTPQPPFWLAQSIAEAENDDSE